MLSNRSQHSHHELASRWAGGRGTWGVPRPSNPHIPHSHHLPLLLRATGCQRPPSGAYASGEGLAYQRRLPRTAAKRHTPYAAATITTTTAAGRRGAAAGAAGAAATATATRAPPSGRSAAER